VLRPEGKTAVPDTPTPQQSEDPVISIGVLAKRVGLSVSAVRKYENEGLLIAFRTEAGHRLFSHEDIARVRNIHRLIQDVGLNIEAIRRMQALLPCWELRPCDAETRGDCPAYAERARPCWTLKSLACTRQGNECRQCDVYRLGSLCMEETKHLFHHPSDRHEVGSAVMELLERKRHTEATEN
jgi:MerR family transcriptional regulator, heat shock protein HspR